MAAAHIPDFLQCACVVAGLCLLSRWDQVFFFGFALTAQKSGSGEQYPESPIKGLHWRDVGRSSPRPLLKSLRGNGV